MKKSKTDKKLDGVLGGIAEYCNVDSTLLRLGYFVFGCFYTGLAIIMYVGASIIMSNADSNSETDNTENKE
jgi:phage shock protein C, pspC